MGIRGRLLVVVVLFGIAPCVASAATGPGAGWHLWWGQAASDSQAVTLSSTAPGSPIETHSALMTSTSSWRDESLSFTTTTLAQLRTGSSPNPWEVGWAMFRFRDLHDYYWFMLKTNGWELGKKQGSDTQIFLATGGSPALVPGHSHRVRISAVGARIVVTVDGVRVVDYADANPIRSGSVGLYEEDSVARFESVAAGPA